MRSFVFGIAALVFVGAAAAVPTELEMHPSPTLVYPGYNGGPIKGTLRFAYDCSRFPLFLQKGNVTIYLDGGRPNQPDIYWFYGRCDAGVYTQEIQYSGSLRDDSVRLGLHTMTARFHGFGELEPSVAAPVPFNLVSQFTGTPAGGRGPVGVSLLPLGENQSLREGLTVTVASMAAPASPAPPPGLQFPFGFVNFTIPKNLEFHFLCPPQGSLGEIRTENKMVLVVPEPLPAGTTVWAYTPHAADPAPQWQQVAATIDGDHVRAIVRGGFLSTSTGRPLDSVLRGSLAVALPRDLGAPPNLQDAWWGGASENGWGVSVTQRDSRIFLSLSLYDGAGLPMWLIMPEGQWDIARGIFSGSLYRPPSAERLGASIGSASLTMVDSDTATLAYSIYGASGTKTIRRFAFGVSSEQTASQAGVWGLVGDGTGGLTINRGGDQLFATWLKFAASGPGEWLVMPGGAWTSADTFEGLVYRTSGSAWIGVNYDPSRFRALEVGRMQLRFTGDHAAEMSYTVDGVTGTALLERHWF